jgi:hypothetical protein
MQECKPYHFVMVEAKTTDDSPDLGELVEILGGKIANHITKL